MGEILWDVLPTGKQPGGAPFNVAVHLYQLGQSVDLISRVGDDDLGRQLLAFLEERNLRTDFVQHGPAHQTGVVKANVDDRHEVVYEIVQPVAWDYIQYDEALAQLISAADMLVFGSLASRTPATRATLYRLLPQARFKVFDVNLRPPHYTREVVGYLLENSNLVKMNHHELAEIMGWFGKTADDELAIEWLAARFSLQAVCVTLGAEGALLYTNGQLHRSAGFPIEVKDTIGSGDAFLAALLTGWQAGLSPTECLHRACATGALVATHQGATPIISEADVVKLLNIRTI
ncbi:fructokinase [Hymenobacter cavernae]|uniref:Fructokinase n=1 Tax=Hymenobacter cavernae TaxID=2044852 RepID=A0ABQ1UP67_9BACT|nr:fructokinase [Hymenobacter cavernae]